MKKIKFKDIAKMADVSTTTVSHIFNGNVDRHRISDHTRMKVINIARQYQHQPNIQRAIIKATRTKTIGVIVPDMSNISFSLFLHKLETIASQQGIQLLIACSHYDSTQEITSAQNLLQRKVDGIITITSLIDDNFYKQIQEETPVLFYDRYIHNSNIPCVTSESIQSVADLVAKKAKVLGEFYFLAADSQLSTINERLIGFKQGIQQAGLTINSDWILCEQYQENIGYYLTEKLVATLGRIPKAIFTPSGNLLEGVLLYLKQQQVKRQDIYLCSYDYNLYHNLLCYDVDIIAQNYDNMVKICFRSIQSLIERKQLKQQLTYIKPRTIYYNQQ